MQLRSRYTFAIFAKKERRKITGYQRSHFILLGTKERNHEPSVPLYIAIPLPLECIYALLVQLDSLQNATRSSFKVRRKKLFDHFCFRFAVWTKYLKLSHFYF